MATRLPTPGGDDGSWGAILNDFLSVELNADGSLKRAAAITQAQSDATNALNTASTAVQSVNGKTGTAVTLAASDVGAPTQLAGLSDVNANGASDTQVLSYNGASSKWVASTVSSTTVNDASNTNKGIVQLGGDIAGNNNPAAPAITNGAVTDAKVNAAANIAQSKIANLTSDLAAKAPLASPTFTGTVTVPTPSNGTDATTKTYVDTAAASGTPDANSSTKGKLQLTGDLGGTAASPQVVATHLSSALPVNQGGTGSTSQNFVDLSNTQTIGGAKSFSSSVAVPGGTVVPSDWVNVKVYGAKGDNSTDDLTAIQNAINACPAGGTVYFPAGLYVVTNTLTISANITLRGVSATRWPQYGGVPVYLKPKFGSFNGTTLLSATEIDGWHIVDMNLSSGRAVGPGSAPVDALYVTGACKGVRLQNVLAYNFSGYGIHTDSTANGWPGGWEVSNLNLHANALGGWRSDNSASVTYSFSDAVIHTSEAGANNGDGWHWAGVAAVDFFGLRSTWNVGYGFYIAGGSSNVSFTECQTDRSNKDGWYINATDGGSGSAPAPHVVLLTACTASRDGRNSNAGQAGYAGVRIVGNSPADLHLPVVISGFQSHVSIDDTGGGQLSPDYAVYATNAKKVILNGCVCTATVAPTFDDSSAIIDAGNNMFNLVNFTTGTVTFNNTPPVSNRNILNGSQLIVSDGTSAPGNSAGELIKFNRTTDHVGVIFKNTTVAGNNNPMLLSEGPTATSQNMAVRVAADANSRLMTRANGTLEWGDGTASRDVTLARTAAGTLTLNFAGTATTSILDIPGSMQLGRNTIDLGGGVGVLGMANASTAPTTNPSGGGIMYVSGGLPIWRDPGGNTYNLTGGALPATTVATDSSYLAWSFDPVAGGIGATAPSGGVLYLQRIDVRTPVTATKVVFAFASVAGMSLTGGQNFVGIYDKTGALVGSSNDISGSVVAGEISFALSSSASLTANYYWIGVLMNGSTMPTVVRGSAQVNGLGTSQQGANEYRFGAYGTSQTSLPPSITPASITKTQNNAYFSAIA